MFRKNKNNKGFTLIELLVVIAIIGVLSSVVLVSLNGARIKGRDARRIADLREMRKALELYYNVNGFYPSSGWVKSSDAVWSDSSTSGTLANSLSPYISSLPKDPINSSGANWPYGDGADAFTYAYNGTNNSFELLGHLEDINSSHRCYLKHYRRINGNQWCAGDNNPPGNNGSSNYLFTNDPN